MTSKEQFFHIVNSHRRQLIIISLLSIFVSVFYVGFAYVSKYLLDNIGSNKFYTFLYILIGIVIFEILCRLLLTYLQNIFYEKIRVNFKEKIYSDILNTDVNEIAKFNESDLLTRLTSDINIVSRGVMNIIPTAVLAISRIILAFIALFFLDYLFALILLAVGVVVFFITKVLRQRNKRYQQEIQQAEAQSLGFYKEGITNLDILKVFNNRGQIKEKEQRINANYYQSYLQKDNFNLKVNSGFLLVMRLSFLFGIVWCAFRFNQGITIGSLLAIVQLVSQITIPFTNLSGIMPTYYACLASVDRLNEISYLTKEAKKTKVEFQYLTARNVTYSYNRNPIIIDGNFKIARGDFVVINADSGQGKTTLIKLIMGLYQPQRGAILINDELNVLKVGDLYAYLPQVNLMLSGTIRENLLFFVDSASQEEIDQAMNEACIKEEIDELPKGIDTYLSDYGKGLSEGQLQRLSIARVILAKRQVIVLDEATSALDSRVEEKVLHNLKNLNKTIIFISHKKRPLDFANVILTISQGKVAYGKVDQNN